MSRLAEREVEQERRRRQESERLFGHPGASIPEFPGIDWRSEALTLEAQRDRLLAAAAAALERVEVEDPGEAELILSRVVTLSGTYVPPRAS